MSNNGCKYVRTMSGDRPPKKANILSFVLVDDGSMKGRFCSKDDDKRSPDQPRPRCPFYYPQEECPYKESE